MDTIQAVLQYSKGMSFLRSLWKEYKRSVLSLSFIVLFVFTQTAGLLHSEIHPFHEHVASCDVFEHLAEPVNESPSFSLDFSEFTYLPSPNGRLVSVYNAIFKPYQYSRAPPQS